MKNTADERQRIEILKAGNLCFYVVWYALLFSIVAQVIIWKATAQQIMAELAVFLLGGILMLILLIAKGVWGLYTRPNKKTYVLASALTGLAAGGIVALLYDWTDAGQIARHIMWVAIFAAGAFIGCYALLSLAGHLIQRRQASLVRKYDQDD
jgi:peptidoglycan/LPS O-acetylase OafA/YrhL